MGRQPIRVVVVDRREIFREGLVKILKGVRNIDVVDKCSCGLEAIARARHVKSDVTLLDTELLDCNFAVVAHHIQEESPDTRIVVLTHSESPEHFFPALQSGVVAYVSKDTEIDDLLKVISLVRSGEVIVTPPMATVLLHEFSQVNHYYEKAKVKPEVNLTARENEILTLVAEGATNREIASSLFITENTVKVHLRRVMEKLHVRSRHQAAALVLERSDDTSD